jgi:hypothetical protein
MIAVAVGCKAKLLLDPEVLRAYPQTTTPERSTVRRRQGVE